MSEPRKKFCYVGAPTIFKLELACKHIVSAWGEVCYLVGSSLERPDWRDIDVVMILDDDEFSRLFPNASVPQGAFEFDHRWLLMTVALSDWLSQQCGAKVDFKFQPRTQANNRHKGPRHALGMTITRGME